MGRRWRHTVCVLLALAATAFSSGPARAWGAEGHRVIALIAERHLTPAAQAAVGRLLALEDAADLAAIANWADDIRGPRRETAPWHFVDIPLEAAGYDPARDCPAGTCVVAKLGQFAAVLADPAASDRKREIALNFVVHFAGDLHQPLHSTDHHDRGGNDLPVVYRGHRSNLHHVWDVELVRQAGGVDPAAFAQRLDVEGHAAVTELPDCREAATPADIATLAAGSPVDWVNETHAAAVSVAYGALPENADDDLAGAYAETARSVVDSQLLKAGLRLAALLNAALK